MCDDYGHKHICTHTHTQIEQKRSKIKTRIRQLFNLMPLIFLCRWSQPFARVVKEQRSHNRLVKPNLQQLREHGKKGNEKIK